MALKQNKLFRHTVLVLILGMAFSAFFTSANICFPGYEAKASEIGPELDYPIEHSGVEHGAVPDCSDIQGPSEYLATSYASCRNLYEKPSFQIHAQQAVEAGLETPSFSDLFQRDSEVNRAEPCKIFLQNQSFLI